jgi:protein tyrosine kinase modulator
VGLALGVALVFALEFLDDRMHNEKEIKALLTMPIIAEIPAIMSPIDQRRKRIRIAFGWTAAVLVVATILAGSAFSYLRG